MRNLSIIFFLLLAGISNAQQGFKINTKSGEISKYCNRLPCTATKSISTKIIKTTAESVVLSAKVLYGQQSNSGSTIKWSNEPRNIIIKCSRTNPTVNGDVLDFSEGVFSYMMSASEMYFNYCHSSKVHPDIAIKKFNYIQ